ncbi:MAG: ATP-dependent serine protease [Tannerellaceae bacterium]|jgi:hypothetical protein|nr:ATP-dependent serine protease [Tannerellaceae bacterium]
MAKRAHTVYNILHKKYDVIPFTGDWEAAFSRPEKAGFWFVSGFSANGKSSFCMQLVRELASLGMKTAYFSWEEGTGLSFQNTIRRAGWAEVNRNIVVEDEIIAIVDFDKWMKKHSRVKVIIIDSLQKWDLKKSDVVALRGKYRDKLFVFISHVKDNGKPDGAVATLINRDALLKIWVEGFRAISKGRLFGPVGYYTVWEEAADKYYARNI